MATQPAPARPVILRTAAVWGTTVLKVRNLDAGESLVIGDFEGAELPKPDGSAVADMPVRAAATGWELDARGATGGELFLRGRFENPAALARTGAPIPIVAGDHGLIQYDNFSVFFQFTEPAPVMTTRRRIDWGLVFSFLFALVAVLGGLALIWAITTPPAIDKPIELTSHAELALKFNMPDEPIEPPDTGKDSEKGKGLKDPGAKDNKEMGGGKKIKGAEGRLGKRGQEKDTEMTGDPRAGLGGMAEVLASDVGEEVRKTLGTISSVADALGGLKSSKIVLGRHTGTGLQGTGKAGGGTEEGGVPFGSGTLDTGWGAGKGGGFGSGKGGPGGRGLGGRGLGGKGEGKGAGDGSGEKKVAGGGKAKRGQGLTPAQIQRVVMSRYGAFRACYEAAAARNPGLKGTVGVAWSITPGGSVTGASISSSSLGNSRVEGCILRQIRRLRFPTADKPTGANYPFRFVPGKK